MALTVTTGLTVIAQAELAESWTGIQSSGSSTVQDEPDFYAQGTQSKSRAVTGAGFKGAMFDNGSGIDFTSGANIDKLVYVWMRTNVPTLNALREGAGVFVRLASGSATTNYREWYVDGSDTVAINQGWVCYVINPRSLGSVDSGTYNAASVRYFGGGATTTTTAKGQNWGIDQISYGRGELRVTGSVTTPGQGFKEIAAATYGNPSLRYGVLTEKAGVFYVRGKIIIGSPYADTTFSSRGEVLVFESPDYGPSGSPTESRLLIPNASTGGTLGTDGRDSYLGLAFLGGDVGSPGGNTTIDIGVIVGTDGGRSGSTFLVQQNPRTGTRTRASIAVNDGNMSLSLYNATFIGFEGQIDLRGTGVSGDDLFGCTFNGCGRIDTNMEMRRCNVLNSVATPDDAAFIWKSDTDCENTVFAGNTNAIVFEQYPGADVDFTQLTFSGNTADVLNESGSAITINVINSTTPSTLDTGSPGSSTTLVINPVATTVTVKNVKTEAVIADARVLVFAADGTGPMPYQESVSIAISGSPNVAVVTHAAHGLVDGKEVWISGADQKEYNGVHTIQYVDANTYEYVVSGSPASPATGTIIATGVVINGVTNGSGVISDTRSHASNQPISGRVRKASIVSPTETLYQTGTFSGTVNSSTGFAVTVLLIPDE